MYTKTKVMTIETKVMDTIFDIVILTQLVHSEPIWNLNKILFKTYSLSDLPLTNNVNWSDLLLKRRRQVILSSDHPETQG